MDLLPASEEVQLSGSSLPLSISQCQQVMPIRHAHREARGRGQTQSILEKVIGATFTPELGGTEVLTVVTGALVVSVVQTGVSSHSREQERFHWSCLWSHGTFFLRTHSPCLACWLFLGILGATSYSFIHSFFAKPVLMFGFPGKPRDLCGGGFWVEWPQSQHL